MKWDELVRLSFCISFKRGVQQQWTTLRMHRYKWSEAEHVIALIGYISEVCYSHQPPDRA